MEKEYKVGMASVLCVAIFVIAWTPFAVLMLVGNIKPSLVISPEPSDTPGHNGSSSSSTSLSWVSLTAAFAKGSAACNGIIYGLCIPKGRLEATFL